MYLSSSPEKRKEYDRLREIERVTASEIQARRAKGCFDAEINDNGKYVCPECKKVEGGTLRIISHRHDCSNNRLQICQEQTGGRKRRKNKTNKKTKRSKTLKRATKLRKSRRHHKH